MRDLLRCLSWRVRQKYRTTGATRATTKIGTTMAGIRVLRGVALEGEEVCVEGAVSVEVGVGDELLVDEGGVLEGEDAKVSDNESSDSDSEGRGILDKNDP